MSYSITGITKCVLTMEDNSEDYYEGSLEDVNVESGAVDIDGQDIFRGPLYWGTFYLLQSSWS